MLNFPVSTVEKEEHVEVNSNNIFYLTQNIVISICNQYKD